MILIGMIKVGVCMSHAEQMIKQGVQWRVSCPAGIIIMIIIRNMLPSLSDDSYHSRRVISKFNITIYGSRVESGFQVSARTFTRVVMWSQ